MVVDEEEGSGSGGSGMEHFENVHICMDICIHILR